MRYGPDHKEEARTRILHAADVDFGASALAASASTAWPRKPA
jgi:hypothetical protein